MRQRAGQILFLSSSIPESCNPAKLPIMSVQKYIEDVQKQFKTGIAREHAYRPALKTLIEELMPEVTAINDPAHIKCGAPDFILHRRNLEVGYMEAKDLDADLSKTEKTDQLKRYLESLDNLVLTDYLEFRFFLHGEKVEVVRIAEIENGAIKPLPENYDRLKALLIDFAAFQGQTIKSAKKLATMMAQKAKLMKHIFYNVVTAEDDSTLKDQFKAFQDVLMHDMDEAQFADVYAQTIAYGLFTARLHDKTKDDFTRSEALLLIPKSNPFLRQLFSYIAGSELDERVIWIVDALCEVFLFSDLDKILEDFGTATGQNDPMLHFYETFLAEYDKSLRKSRGVWYTPEPVVNFIVRAVDEVLKTHFGLKDGIADNSKTTIELETQTKDQRTKTGYKMVETEMHKVQLLDVATGTGTFLAEAVKQIYKRYKGQEGIWSSYVENDLLPRLHGFELLMASYAMCHMKLDLLLQETGYKPVNTANPPRVSVYLTNALEEHHPDTGTLFASWLSREANEASRIKRDMPIMVAMGNPPYSVSSSNKGEFIQTLMKDYKKDLNEKNINPLSDDYIKFIRNAQYYIEKTGHGIVAMITNNSYIDGVIHRQMRKSLLETFDEIYIYDLHGSTTKGEASPDGSKDENVFDIRQGVCISIMVKTGQNKNLADVYHTDSYGKRDIKYEKLNAFNFNKSHFDNLQIEAPNYYFVSFDHNLNNAYEDCFSLKEIFVLGNTGIKFRKDNLLVKNHFNINDVKKMLSDIHQMETFDFLIKYNFNETKDWKHRLQKVNFKDDYENIKKVDYRPFDKRYTYYPHDRINKIIPRGDSRRNLMIHFDKMNLGLVITRKNRGLAEGSYVFCTSSYTDLHLLDSAGDSLLVLPLYRYESVMDNSEQKVPNFDPKIYGKIKEAIADVTPESLFDYIYAVLHSPTYRDRYAEFLKSDFPRIPYPDDPEIFHALAEKGGELRVLHLMESAKLDDPITTYPVSGDHEVIKPRFELTSPSSPPSESASGDPESAHASDKDRMPAQGGHDNVDGGHDNVSGGQIDKAGQENAGRIGKVWINPTQYFGNVPEVAWEFYIGGYQPAQKWLKDRKGRNLSVEDIRHYQRIITALTETDRIMKEIDEINFLPEGE